MIYLYTGTPGSGKSYHVARDIVQKLKRGGSVIANFPIALEYVKKNKGVFVYKDNYDLTVDFLVSYAVKNHVVGRENQTLLVVDEAQVVYNCREFSRNDRMKWVIFFSQHRKFGYNVILVTQNDRMIDKQIRTLCEYEIKHRKVNNYGIAGLIVSLSFTTWFVAVETWYGMKGKESRLGANFFPFQNKYQKIYNSFNLFDEISDELNASVPKGKVPLAEGFPLGARSKEKKEYLTV